MQVVTINITEQCPNRCPGCFSYKSKRYMTLEKFKTIIDKLPKVSTVTLTGGEPFIHKDLAEICKYCSENIVKPQILTSGCVLRQLDDIEDYISNIIVSIKSPVPEQDATWKNNEVCKENVYKLLKEANYRGIGLGINWVVDNQNMQYLEEMVNLANEYKATLYVIRFIPYSNISLVLSLDDEEWNEFSIKAKSYGAKIAFLSPVSYINCTAGITRINILVNGDVTPCLYLTDVVIGNLLKDDFHIIERDAHNWRYRYKRVKGCLAYKHARGYI
mgnify:CR=1 FL=1